MAELIQTEDVPQTQTKKRDKRRKYLSLEHLILTREVAALRAHVAVYGTVRQKYEQVAGRVNLNPHMTQKITWKAVQDRYDRFQDFFDADDARNAGLSGVAGGEMGELYQMLSQMREEKETFVNEKNAVKNERSKKEQEKERLGREIMEMKLLRKSQRGNSEEGSDGDGSAGGEEGTNENGGLPKKEKGKRCKIHTFDMTGGLAMFTEKLKDAEVARIELETEQLKFEREKFEKKRGELEKDREERRKDREAAQNMELKRFEMMMDVLRNNK